MMFQIVPAVFLFQVACRSVYHFYVVLFVVSFFILDCFFNSCYLFFVSWYSGSFTLF